MEIIEYSDYGMYDFTHQNTITIDGEHDLCLDDALSVEKNSDGTYSLYDNRRHNPNSVFHEQIISVSTSGPSFDLSGGSVGLGSIGIDGFNGGWEWEYVDLSLLDIGHAEAGAELKNGNLYVGAFASAYSPSVSFKIFGVKIEIGAEVGAIGGKLNVGSGGFSAKGAFGWGLSLSIDW